MIKENLLWVKLKLTQNSAYRDSKERLYYAFLMEQGYDLNTPTKQFLKDLESSKIPRMDSIARASRHIQKEYPHLRGKNWGKRKKKEVKIKHEILHDC